MARWSSCAPSCATNQLVSTSLRPCATVNTESAAEPVQSPSKRQKAAASSAAAAEQECSERIEADMNELVKLSDEKLNIATQVGRGVIA